MIKVFQFVCSIIANTNITFQDGMAEGLLGNLGMGIVLGLFLGKPVGIFFMSWLSVKMKISQLPENTNWPHVLGLGLLGGIGFTMSIFISLLAFEDEASIETAKMAILLASTVAGMIGFVYLKRSFQS